MTSLDMKIVFSKRCLEFGQLGHPESPERLSRCFEYLSAKKFEILEPSLCSQEDILLAHSNKLLQEVKTNTFSDPDTPNLENIFEFAALSAGAALLSSEIAIKEGMSFSLMRPPGHHSGKERLGGFCYFNNLAIAVEKLRLKNKKVAIIDFDCHHGNGTQDIFLGKDGILYLSLHQAPLYPGTGLASEKNCLNFPLAPGTEEAAYLACFQKGLEHIEKFKPQILAVSAGFDTYRRDPLGGMKLDTSTYRKIGELISRFEKPTFAVLEGGYSKNIAVCLYEFLSGLENLRSG